MKIKSHYAVKTFADLSKLFNNAMERLVKYRFQKTLTKKEYDRVLKHLIQDIAIEEDVELIDSDTLKKELEETFMKFTKTPKFTPTDAYPPRFGEDWGFVERGSLHTDFINFCHKRAKIHQRTAAAIFKELQVRFDVRKLFE